MLVGTPLFSPRTRLFVGLLGASLLAMACGTPAKADAAAGNNILTAPISLTAMAQPAITSPGLTAPLLTASADRKAQLPIVGGPITFALRLGAMVSPRLKFAGGADVTLNNVGIGPNFVTRIDADAIITANLGGVSTLVPVTVDEIYTKSLVAGASIYGGAGIGPYFGDTTRLGGKVFIGGTVTRNLGAEASLHFAGYGNPLLVLQARLPL